MTDETEATEPTPNVRVAHRKDLKKLGFAPSGRMTEWFSPTTLLDMAFRTIWTALVERYADRRETMQLRLTHRSPGGRPYGRPSGVQPEGIYGDQSREPVTQAEPSPGDDFVLDYVADLGDGFHPTFTIAQLIASDRVDPLEPGDSHASERDDDGVMPTQVGAGIRRADVVVMGGDEVYPRAGRNRYRDRTMGPYDWATQHQSSGGTDPVEVYALPGNHDWYDGLAEFTSSFCTPDRLGVLGNWATPQRTSYFALKLPGRWWLLAVDTQLDGSLDYFQERYFREQGYEKDDRVILCWSTPVWSKEDRKPGATDPLVAFVRDVLGPKGVTVPLVLTGDEHYYCRHREVTNGKDGRRMWITAGGGGAFLHPTHTLKAQISLAESDINGPTPGPELVLEPESCFPNAEQSVQLSKNVLAFPIFNPRFLWVTAALSAALAAAEPSRWVFLGFGAAVTAALIGFAKKGYNTWWSAAPAGFLHGTLQVGGAWLVMHALRERFDNFLGFGLGALIWTAAADVLMGAYLFASIRLGAHPNEAFSAIRSQRFKNFVRLQFLKNGDLVVHPIGVQKPGNWAFAKKVDGDALPPGEAFEIKQRQASSPPVLIEAPLRFCASTSMWGPASVTAAEPGPQLQEVQA